jgi:hypothetical protein
MIFNKRKVRSVTNLIAEVMVLYLAFQGKNFDEGKRLRN